MNKQDNKSVIKWGYAQTHKIALDGPSVLSNVEVLIASRLRERHRRSVAEPETETADDSGRLVEAVDDFVDVKLRLAPAGTLMESGYLQRANVREYYKVGVPKEGSEDVALNISSFCADSVMRDDSYLERYPEKSLSDLMASGKMAVTGGGDVSGLVAFQGLPRLSSFLVCENQNASDALMAGGKQSGGEPSSKFDFDYESRLVIPLENDTLGERYLTRVEFDDGHGTFYGGGDGRGLVPGEYGMLKFQGDRFISYIPKADTDVIGKVDVFTYKATDRSGAEDTANIIVRIGSDQADLEWDPNDPYAQALRAKVWDYADSATVEIVYQTTTVLEERAISYSWQLDDKAGASGATAGSKTFTIDEQCQSNLIIDIQAEALPELLKCIEIEFAKLNGHWEQFIVAPYYGVEAEHMKVTDGRIEISVADLEPGDYRLEITNLRNVATPGSLHVDLAFENTRYWEDGTRAVAGNVIEEMGRGDEAPRLAVSIDGKAYEMPNADGSQVRGKFGVLTIKPDGSYVYEPDSDLDNIGEFDSFRYQLQRSDGTMTEERLTIGIKGESRPLDSAINGGAEAQGAEHDAGEEAARLSLIADAPEIGVEQPTAASHEPLAPGVTEALAHLDGSRREDELSVEPLL